MCICGECEYYVPRPPEVTCRCTLDGVCLSRGRAVSSKFTGDRLYGGTYYVVGVGSICTRYKKKVNND